VTKPTTPEAEPREKESRYCVLLLLLCFVGVIDKAYCARSQNPTESKFGRFGLVSLMEGKESREVRPGQVNKQRVQCLQTAFPNANNIGTKMLRWPHQ
jgi:hypothetical protein